MKYGPNTKKIEAILGQIGELTPEQAEKLVLAWDAAWEATQNAARAVFNSSSLGAISWEVSWDAILYTVRTGVRGAARDAILALLVEGKISPEHFETLYGPWKSVMES